MHPGSLVNFALGRPGGGNETDAANGGGEGSVWESDRATVGSGSWRREHWAGCGRISDLEVDDQQGEGRKEKLEAWGFVKKIWEWVIRESNSGGV